MKFNKTDKELEQMSEDELFAYLDAKSAHLKKQTIWIYHVFYNFRRILNKTQLISKLINKRTTTITIQYT